LSGESPPERVITGQFRRSAGRSAGWSDQLPRIWHAFGLQPYRPENFKLSTAQMFVEKVRDIVGLYSNPPMRAVGMCDDEKSQIRALDRTQPMLQLRPGLPARRMPA
jgi:hypothetical protein